MRRSRLARQPLHPDVAAGLLVVGQKVFYRLDPPRDHTPCLPQNLAIRLVLDPPLAHPGSDWAWADPGSMLDTDRGSSWQSPGSDEEGYQ